MSKCLEKFVIGTTITRVTCLIIGWLLLPAMACATLPDFIATRDQHPSCWAEILDRNGLPLQAIQVLPDPQRLAWISLDDISPVLLQAVLKSEDQRFFRHHGVDWRAVLGAAWENLIYNTHRGASTLTMQLVGLLDPSLARHAGGRSIHQKWRQVNAASALEQRWSKQQILEAYLNLAEFRPNLYGLHAASVGLFQAEPDRLTSAQAVLLAALLRGPNASTITISQRACELAEQLKTNKPSCSSIRKLVKISLNHSIALYQNENLAPIAAQLLKPKPGTRLFSSLDRPLQRLCAVKLQQALKQTGFPTGGVLVLDAHTNEIRAWVSSGQVMMPNSHLPDTMAASLPQLYLLALAQHIITTSPDATDTKIPDDTDRLQTPPQDAITQPDDTTSLINEPHNDPTAIQTWINMAQRPDQPETNQDAVDPIFETSSLTPSLIDTGNFFLQSTNRWPATSNPAPRPDLSPAEALDQTNINQAWQLANQLPAGVLTSQYTLDDIQVLDPQQALQIQASPLGMANLWQSIANPTHACPAGLHPGGAPVCRTLDNAAFVPQITQWLGDPALHNTSSPPIPAAWLSHHDSCTAWQAGFTAKSVLLVWLNNPSCLQPQHDRNPANPLWNRLVQPADARNPPARN